MKKNIYLIVITIVTIVAILFGVFWHLAPAADFSLPWEHNGRSGAGSEKTTNVWEEKELGECRSISITLNAADIILEKGDQCSIRYDGNQNKIPDVKAENGKWTIDQKKKTNLHFGINNIRENKLTITLPEGMIPESATIKADAGDIKIRDIQIQKLDINADAGDIDFERDEIQDLVIDLDAGDVAQLKLWNLAIKYQTYAALAAQDMLIVHLYAGTANTAVFAERYDACAVRPTGLGGEGGGVVGMPIDVTYGGKRTVGTASVSTAGVVTFTPAA